MAQLNKPLDTTNIDTSDEFQPIPEGWYSALICASDERSNNNNTGRLIELQYVIGSGPHQGKKVKDWYNYIHDNKKAQDIAEKHLAQIMEAAEVTPPLQDTAQLHNKSLEIFLEIDGTYNRVTRYRNGRDPSTGTYNDEIPDFTQAANDSEHTPEWQK